VHTATTTLILVPVALAARVTAVRKMGVMAVARTGTKMRRAPVLVLVLLLDLMFVLPELAPFMTMLELQAMVLPTVNAAKVATAAAPTVTTALMRVHVVRATIVPAVCKTAVMSVARAGTKADRTPVLAVTVLLDRMLGLVELALVATKFELNRLAPTTANTRVATAAAHTATTTLMLVPVELAAIVTAVRKMGVMAVAMTGTKMRRAPVLVLVLLLDLMLVLLELAPSLTMLELQAMVPPTVNAKVATAAERMVKTALWRVVVVRSAIVTAVCKKRVMVVARANTMAELTPVLAVTVLRDRMLDLVELALVATKFELNRLAPTTANTRVATATARTATTTLILVPVALAARVTAVRKMGVVAVTRAGSKVRRVPVLVLVLVLDLMFVFLELASVVTMLELQAMMAQQVNAKQATAAERTVKPALWRVVVVRAAIVTAVCKTRVMAVARANTKAELTPVLAVTVLRDRMLDLVELALVATKLELNRLAPTTANTRVATAAAHRTTTTLLRVLAVRAARVPAVRRMGVVAVTRAGTKAERTPVLAVTVLRDRMLDLVELALVATKFELNRLAPTTANTSVATAAAHTTTATLMRVLVVRAAVVTAVRKMRVVALTREGTVVRRAPVLVLVLVLDLMFVLLELAPFVTMLELQAMVAPQVNAKQATAAERTVKPALWRVVVVRAAIVTAVCKTRVMAVARAGTRGF